nr:MAG TPA: hypothetical protein [Bacteriophage sp.]
MAIVMCERMLKRGRQMLMNVNGGMTAPCNTD